MEITLHLEKSQSNILCIMNELEGAKMTNEEFANDLFTNALIHKWLMIKKVAGEQGTIKKNEDDYWEIVRETDKEF